jgi:hypothetical protein
MRGEITVDERWCRKTRVGNQGYGYIYPYMHAYIFIYIENQPYKNHTRRTKKKC